MARCEKENCQGDAYSEIFKIEHGTVSEDNMSDREERIPEHKGVIWWWPKGIVF